MPLVRTRFAYRETQHRSRSRDRFLRPGPVARLETWTSERANLPQPGRDRPAFAATIYLAAFITGAIVMSFEMLGSRYLNPYFGSGIYTWASLISTVLAALCVGYFIGGIAADRYPSATVLGATVLIGSAYILVLPLFSEALMEAVLAAFDDVKAGSLAAAFVILFFPVTFLGMYSPFGIRLLLHSAQSSGRVSGTVYGVSTFGSIVGTLGTTFILIPVDRHPRDHLDARHRRHRLRPAADRDCRSCGAAPLAARARARRRAAGARQRPDRRERSAPTCSSAPTAASRISRPNTTTSSSPSGATS